MDRSKSYKEKIYIDIVVLSIFPVFFTIISGIIVDLLIGDLRYGHLSSALTVWISMIIGMFIFPIIYLRKNDNAVCNPVDLGLEIDFPLVVILITLVIIFLIVVKTMIFKGDIVFALVQNIPIAFCEEFWCKGVIFTQLKHIFKNNYIVILISAIIFAFITHLGQSFLANLVVRFPFGLVSGFIYYKTGKLIYPVLLHLLYNAMIV